MGKLVKSLRLDRKVLWVRVPSSAPIYMNPEIFYLITSILLFCNSLVIIGTIIYCKPYWIIVIFLILISAINNYFTYEGFTNYLVYMELVK